MITLKEVFNKFSLVKMNSCAQEILCAFSDEYADYLLPVCQQPNLIIDLLKIADSSIPEVYFQENCPDQSTLIALPDYNKKIFLASRNIDKTSVEDARNLNVLDIMNHKYLLITKDSIKTIEKTFIK